MSTDDRIQNGGPPTRSEIAERLARVEEGQEHVIEKIDGVAETLDEDVNEIEGRVEEIEPRHDRLWIVYQGIKWGAGIGSGGGVLALLLTAGF